jgi:hypothetical protein
VAQGLKSTAQEEYLKVVEYLGGKAVEKNIVVDRISEEFYEALPGRY